MKVASLLGNSFSIKNLATVMEISVGQVADNLMTAFKAQLISPLANGHQLREKENGDHVSIDFRFNHDKIQQAVKQLIAPDAYAHFSLKIARLMYESNNENIEAKLFSIVSHYNNGKELLTIENERQLVKALNRSAGKKAKESSAFKAALVFFQNAIDLGSESDWATDYETAFELHLNLAESELLCSNYPKAEAQMKSLLIKANSKSHKVLIHKTLIFQYTIQGRYQEALFTCRDALRLYKIKFIPNPSLIQILPLLLKTKLRLTFINIPSLLHRPDITNKDMIQVMEILSQAATAAYIHKPESIVQVSLKILEVTLNYGNAPVSAFAYALMGFIESAKFGNHNASNELMDLAHQVNQKYDDPIYRCKVKFSKQFFTQHNSKPVEDAIPQLEEAFQAGLNAGDYNYACYTLIAGLEKRLFTGVNLRICHDKACDFSEFTTKIEDKYSDPLMIIGRLFTSSLTGVTNSEWGKIDEKFDEQAFLKDQKATGYYMGVAWYYTYMSIKSFFLNRIDEALSYSQEARTYVDDSLIGQVSRIEFYLFSTIIIVEKSKRQSGVTLKHRLQILRNLAILKYWSRVFPPNFKGRYLLARASVCSLKRKPEKAIRYYRKAIEHFHRTGHCQLTALSHELVGREFLETKETKESQVQIRESHKSYTKWGAFRKTEALEKEFPFINTGTNASRNLTTATISSTQILDIDLNTINKAFASIATEIKLDVLLHNLIKLINQNVGSNNAILLLLDMKQNDYFVAADSNEALEMKDHLKGMTINENSKKLPNAIVNYVARTKTELVINDPENDDQFSNSEYVIHSKPQSILAVPIIKQGAVFGIIYLENNLSKNAFTKERLNLVRMLSSQAVISIENAILYRTMEKKVRDRTLELNDKNEKLSKLFEEKKSLVRILCHDLNNTITVLQLSTDIAYQKRERADVVEKNLGRVRKTIATQKDIITHVREMEAVKSGKKKIKLEPVAVDELIEKASFMFKEKFESKQLIFDTSNVEKISGIMAEKVTVTNNVFNNIVSNAIKFSRKGGVISVAVNQPQDSKVCISIKDSGIGMPKEILENIFKNDKETSRKGTEGEAGTGFGMPIVKSFMEIYGGDIQVESIDESEDEQNHGTTFHLYFNAA